MSFIEGKKMKEMVESIRAKYIDVQRVIGNDFSINHLEDSAFVSKLNESIENAYIEINEGMCEEIKVCKTCAENRDNLREVMVMLEDIEEGATITDSVGDHFMAFSLELNQVLERIDGVLAEI